MATVVFKLENLKNNLPSGQWANDDFRGLNHTQTYGAALPGPANFELMFSLLEMTMTSPRISLERLSE